MKNALIRYLATGTIMAEALIALPGCNANSTASNPISQPSSQIIIKLGGENRDLEQRVNNAENNLQHGISPEKQNTRKAPTYSDPIIGYNERITDYTQVKDIVESVYFGLTGKSIPANIKIRTAPLEEIRRISGNENAVAATKYYPVNGGLSEILFSEEEFYKVISDIVHEFGHAKYDAEVRQGWLSNNDVTGVLSEAIAFSFESAALSLLEEKYGVKRVSLADTVDNNAYAELLVHNMYMKYKENKHEAANLLVWLTTLKEPSLGLRNSIMNKGRLDSTSAMKLHEFLITQTNSYASTMLESVTPQDLQDIRNSLKKKLKGKVNTPNAYRDWDFSLVQNIPYSQLNRVQST